MIGVGTDIVDIRRIEKLLAKNGKQFVDRVFNKAEQVPLKSAKAAAHYAKRYAGKEAIAKAMGTGIGAKLAFKDITITKNKLGAPVAKVKGLKGKVHLSLSDEKNYALAFAIIEKQK